MRTIIFNGEIYIENNHMAQAVCIENGVITHIGTNEEILSFANDTDTKIDAQGRSVIPGFNDSHNHIYSVGTALESIELYGSTSIEEVIQRSKDFISLHNPEKGTFLTGRGWNQDYFTDENRPLNRHDLDRISTEYPIVFNRACGHMMSCNTLALEVCGITNETPQVEGAEFYFGEDGLPNGIFTEQSIDLVASHIPAPTVEQMTASLNTAMDYALSLGITSLQTNDMNASNYRQMFDAFEAVYNNSKARPRTYHQCFFMEPNGFKSFLNDGFKTGFGSDYNKIGPLKMFVDGSLGARTALLRAPYADDHSTCGITCMTQEQLNEMISIADQNDCQVAIHVIGDKAVEMVLDGYDTVINGENNHRHAVIHCQITDRPMLDRIKNKNILVQAQPIFIHYDMHIVEDRVGAQLAKTSYAFGDMHRMGINISYGTDSPVENLNTMDNLYCAVTRKDLNGNPTQGYNPEQCVSLADALMMYTQAGAYVSFDENTKGKLLPGYMADLVILDRNIFDMDAENLRDVTVDMTMVGGLVAYQK